MSIPARTAAIRDRHADYWRSAAALKEAIAVWGAAGHVNDCGVFADYKLETVAHCGQAVAEVGIYQLREGVYVHCCHFTSATAGFGYAPRRLGFHAAHDGRTCPAGRNHRVVGENREPRA